MKTLKSLFAVGLITAALAGTSALAVSPRWADSATVTPGVSATDYAHSQTALGNAAKSKASGPEVTSISAKSDPNLVACHKVGKAVCPICGTAVPCSTSKTKMACCN